MSVFVRLIEAAAVLKPIAVGVSIRQALPKIIKLAAIAVTTSVLAASVIMFALYSIHFEMTLHGFGPERALIITFCVACMALILFVLWLLKSIEEFKHALLPKPKGMAGIIDSFMEGIKASAPVEPAQKD
jgi:hypothetical protein